MRERASWGWAWLVQGVAEDDHVVIELLEYSVSLTHIIE